MFSDEKYTVLEPYRAPGNTGETPRMNGSFRITLHLIAAILWYGFIGLVGLLLGAIGARYFWLYALGHAIHRQHHAPVLVPLGIILILVSLAIQFVSIYFGTRSTRKHLQRLTNERDLRDQAS